MSNVAVLAHLASVLEDTPSRTTVQRTLGLAGTPVMLERIARTAQGPGRTRGS